jgi:hypothetical protein
MIHHGTTDSLAVSWSLEFPDDFAPRHDADTIRQSQHLVEIFADEDDRSAALAGGQQTLMHGIARARIQAAARTVRDHNGRAAAELAGDDQLLGVAAGQQSGLLFDG